MPPARPGEGEVKVRPGDTLFAIAQRERIPLRALIDANRMKPPYALHAGERLRLPALRRHVVAPGETLFSIARRYGVEMRSVVRLNAIPPPYTIRSGQVLILPVRVVRVAAKAPQSVTRAPQRGSVPGKKAKRRGREGRFLWPVRGRVISRFGAKPGGLHNDGINIAVAQGAPVHAAADGVVVYAGNELRGFGNLVLIRHRGGWVTAYAHNERLLVVRGQEVRRGDVIARAGATGGVSEPQTHFELRRGREPVDPLKYLAAR